MSQDKKYQVFISSTYVDLKDEREYAMKAVLEMGHIPIGMELFQASDETQWQLIQKRIDESDYYVLILAHRYGSTDDDGIGYTEKEYDYAILKGVPVLSFIIDESTNWLPKFIDKGDDLEKLLKFKTKASHKKMIQFWTNKDNLNSKIKSSLQNQIIINPRNGWVRADETDYKNVAGELARLSKENEDLKGKLSTFNDDSKYEQIIKKLKAVNLTITFNNQNDNVDAMQIFILSFDRLYLNKLTPNNIWQNVKVLLATLSGIEVEQIVLEESDIDIELLNVFISYDLISIVTNPYYGFSEQGLKLMQYVKRNEIENRNS